jgi:hypothetical protein
VSVSLLHDDIKCLLRTHARTHALLVHGSREMSHQILGSDIALSLGSDIALSLGSDIALSLGSDIALSHGMHRLLLAQILRRLDQG